MSPMSASDHQPSPPQLQILSDFSYGWQLVHAMTPLMQEQVNNSLEKKDLPKTVGKVRSDPRMVAQLRTTFLKLAAAMEVVSCPI